MSPSIRRFAISVCLTFLFGLIIPAWTASVKANSLAVPPSATMVEPVTKAIAGARKFLLGRLEGIKQKETAVRVFSAIKVNPAEPLPRVSVFR